MQNWSIRIKLGLLAGVPVLGALALGVLIAEEALRSANTAAALGSVEELAVLVGNVGEVVQSLQTERALALRTLGTGAGDPAASARGDVELTTQWKVSDRAQGAIQEFLAQRDMSRMPERLARDLGSFKQSFGTLGAMRPRALRHDVGPADLITAYADAIHALVGATAALAELTDDGDILRNVNASVAVLELGERASQQQAWISYVLLVKEFPPGAYKALVTIASEEQTYDAVFRLSAPRSVLRLRAADATQTEYAKADELRRRVLAATDDDFDVSPSAWFDAQGAKVKEIAEVQHALMSSVRTAAIAKIGVSRRAAMVGGGMAASVLTVSLLLAALITRGILRSVRALQSAVQRVGQGDMEARVLVTTSDEIGHLGNAFNGMVQEIAESRAALGRQFVMKRELEIAATIQQALLPPSPMHPDFEFAGRMSPADEVGGDFYDVLTDPADDSLWITVGDVSGHGLGAGLVMLMAQSAFGAHFRADPKARPERVIRGVNGLLCESIGKRMHEDKYVTAQVWTYEGEGRFAVGGAHVWPIVYRAAERRSEVFELTGPWLGIIEDLDEIPVTQIALAPGDVLCLYSDGLTESRDAKGELFDVERMASAVTSAASNTASLSDAADAIMKRVGEHAAEREDDWTLLLVRRRDKPLSA